MISNYTFIGLLLVSQWAYSGLQTCIDSGGKWDDSQQTCTEGRVWQKAPSDLLEETIRPLTTIEKGLALEKMGYYLAKQASNGETPKAYILIGTAGAGKSSMVRNLHKYFEGAKLANNVLFDGDIIRDSHCSYSNAVNVDPQIGYTDLWLSLKKDVQSFKREVFDRLIDARKHVIIPTGINTSKYYKVLEEVGYEIRVLGVHVQPDIAFLRGKNRAEWTGRVYTGSPEHWRKSSSDINKFCNHPSTKSCVIVDNSGHQNPITVFKR